jgi:hypothetical protein
MRRYVKDLLNLASASVTHFYRKTVIRCRRRAVIFFFFLISTAFSAALDSGTTVDGVQHEPV